ncbi:hypothetical protein ACHAWF_013154 [Thalassiosira exigua]
MGDIVACSLNINIIIMKRLLRFIGSLLLVARSSSGFQPPQRSFPSPRTSPAALQRAAGAPEPASRSKEEAPSVVDVECSRRRLLGRALPSAAAVAASLALNDPLAASAKVVAAPSVPSGGNSIPERDALLRAIAGGASDDAVADAIERLVPLSPLKGSDASAASSCASALEGTWRLLWYNKSDFSPLLKLPSPLRPDSYQYFGATAAAEVGEGRVAQGLVGGVLGALGPKTELWLSSGAVAAEGRPSTLEIYPPFRFELGELPGSTKPKRTIVEAGSDAEFRAANARSTEAQLAPKNEYEQLYLEDRGRGSLRVSVVARGDPVIVGDMFVHQKL